MSDHEEAAEKEPTMLVRSILITETYDSDGERLLNIEGADCTIWDRLGMLEFALEATKECVRHMVRPEHED